MFYFWGSGCANIYIDRVNIPCLMHDTSPIFVYICHPTDCITVCACWWCHPILVIMTVGNTEYQRTDDISIDPKCLETKSQETIDFALWSMNCLNCFYKHHNELLSQQCIFSRQVSLTRQVIRITPVPSFTECLR